MDTTQVTSLVNKIPRFSGQKEEIQLEEFVRQIETFPKLVQWTDSED
jgi:predicted metal-dependent RNase